MSDVSGIDKALQLAAQGSTKLEYVPKPTLKDKKDAQTYFKRAAKIMDAVVALEEEGIYETGPKPDPEPEKPLPGVPLDFEGATPPPPLDAEHMEAFDGLTPEQQIEWFETRLGRFVDRIGSPVDTTPWLEAWAIAPRDTFRRLLVAENRETNFIDVPTDEEMDAFDGLTPDPADEFDTWDEATRQANFDDLIDKLESEGLEQGDLALATWKAAEKTWRKAWKADAADTFRRLRFAVHERAVISWSIPTDEEMAPPEEPEFTDPLAEEGGEA